MCQTLAQEAFQIHDDCAAVMGATPSSPQPRRTEMTCAGTRFRLDSVLTRDNIGLSVVELSTDQPVVFRCLPPIDHVILHIPVDGRCETQMQGSEKVVENSPGEVMLIAPHTGRHRDVLFHKEGVNRFAQITMDLETFDRVNRDLGIALEPSHAKDLRHGGARVISRKGLPPVLMLSINQLFSAHHALLSQETYMRAKALEFLAIFSIAEEWEPQVKPPAELQPAVKYRVERARDILLSDMENAPAIPELARQVKLGESTLRTAFKKRFGQSVHAYLTDKRLDRARDLLMSESWRSVSDVAFEVGLRSPGRFASMFESRFGILPSALKGTQNVRH